MKLNCSGNGQTHLNGKNQVTGVGEVSIGGATGALVHPGEILKAAILANAPSIIIAHNHPS